MQQRYYDPIAGRFLSVDPIVTDANTGAGFGLYTYVDNNPYAKIDPDGREPAECSESCTRMRAISDSGSLGISTTSAIESFATGGYGAKFSQSVSAGNYGQAGLNLGAGVAYGLANVATFGEAGAVVGMLKNSANASLPVITKAVNSNLPHAVKRAVERGVFADERAAADGLRALSDGIKNNGLPHGTIWDTARLDRVLVPVGNAGMAVYQIAKNGVAKLKTVLKEISE